MEATVYKIKGNDFVSRDIEIPKGKTLEEIFLFLRGVSTDYVGIATKGATTVAWIGVIDPSHWMK